MELCFNWNPTTYSVRVFFHIVYFSWLGNLKAHICKWNKFKFRNLERNFKIITGGILCSA